MVSPFLDMSPIVPRSTDGGLPSCPSRSTQPAAQTDHVAPPPSAAPPCSLGISRVVLRRTGAPPRAAALHGYVDDEGLCTSQALLLSTVGGSVIHLLQALRSARHKRIMWRRRPRRRSRRPLIKAGCPSPPMRRFAARVSRRGSTPRLRRRGRRRYMRGLDNLSVPTYCIGHLIQ